MWSNHEELNQVKRDLAAGKTATPVTIRTFLSWFGVQRRTALNVDYVNKELEKVGVHTLPNYLNIWVDTPITFELDVGDGESASNSQLSENTAGAVEEGDENLQVKTSEDLSFKVGKLVAANTAPVSVKPNAPLKEAITIMLARNFSQIPVMTNEREVKGVVSWTSIGARLAIGAQGPDVQSYMDDHQEIAMSASLFSAIKIITEHTYVLVRALDKKISGIVTATDISIQFEEISTPFLLIGDIENHLRYVIDQRLTCDDVKSACGDENLPKDFSGASDLNFGHYIRILQNDANWQKLGLQLDRKAFCSELSDINSIRMM